MPAYSANILSHNNAFPGFSFARASSRKDYFRSKKVLGENTPVINKGIFVDGEATNQFIDSNLKNTAAVTQYCTKEVTTSLVRTITGDVPVVLKNNTANASANYCSMLPNTTMVLSSRYSMGVIAKLGPNWKDTDVLYIQCYFEKNGVGSQTPVTFYSGKDRVSNNSAEAPSLNMETGVVELSDGWFYIWQCFDTDPLILPQVSRYAFVIGINHAQGRNIAVGEEIVYIDEVFFSNYPNMSFPITTNGFEVTRAAELLNLSSALLDKETMTFDFEPSKRNRSFFINNTEITVGVDEEKISLVRSGNGLSVYADGSLKGNLPYSSNDNISIRTNGHFVLRDVRTYKGIFDDDTIPLITFTKKGASTIISRALGGTKLVPIGSVQKEPIAIVQEAVGSSIDLSNFTVSDLGGTVYLEPGIRSVFRIIPDKVKSDLGGFANMNIEGVLIDGIYYWSVSMGDGQPYGSAIVRPIARIRGLHDPSMVPSQVNSYHYDIINDQQSLLIAAGDKLAYEIYSPITGSAVGFDAEIVGGHDPAFRHYGQTANNPPPHAPILDQNGIDPHPHSKNGGFADMRWYRRVFDLSVIAGKTMRNWCIVLEDESRTYTTVYVRNVVILDANNNVKVEILTDRVVTPQLKLATYGGSVNYRDIMKAMLTAPEVAGVVPLL